MTTFTIVLSTIISLTVLYYIIKAAVRNGIKEGHTGTSNPDQTATAEQIKLQQRYDKGEITFE